jgi:hypothetical protein
MKGHVIDWYKLIIIYYNNNRQKTSVMSHSPNDKIRLDVESNMVGNIAHRQEGGKGMGNQ